MNSDETRSGSFSGPSGTQYRVAYPDSDHILIERARGDPPPFGYFGEAVKVLLHRWDAEEMAGFIQMLDLDWLDRALDDPAKFGEWWWIDQDDLQGVDTDHVSSVDPPHGHLILHGLRLKTEADRSPRWLCIQRGEESLVFPLADRQIILDRLAGFSGTEGGEGA